MQDKQKVTFYLSPELHRKLKIRSAIESEPMSDLVERALFFYLAHPDVVDEMDAVSGQTHRVYACPECMSSVVLRDGEMVSLSHSDTLADDEIPVGNVTVSGKGSQGEGELVPC